MFKYSVILPTFNDSIDDLNKLLSSISSNTRDDIELIIVDDSNDSFRSELRNLNFQKLHCKTIFNNNRMGLSHSCNQGIQIANGTYLVFLNVDNIVPHNYFSLLDEELVSEYDFLSVNNRVSNINDKYASYVNFFNIKNIHNGNKEKKLKYKKNISYTEGCVIKTEVVKKSNGFLDWKENNLKAGEDLIFADKIRGISSNARYSEKILVKHTIPSNTREFFYNRYIRGYGTIQIYKFYRKFNNFKIIMLFFLRNLIRIFYTFTIFKLFYLFFFGKYVLKLDLKLLDFTKAFFVENVAIIYGELISLLKILKTYKITEIDLTSLD